MELHYGCLKVRDYEEPDFKKLYKFMLALCKLAGVTEAPDNEIILLLIDHIQDYHKDFSKEEIQKAFSLAMANKLDFEFNHYNKLTPQLISKTLDRYKEFRSKEIIAYEYKLKLEKIEEEKEKNKPNPEQQFIQNIKNSISSFLAYCAENEKEESERKEINDWGNIRYDFLDNLNLIPFTIEEKEEIKEEAKKTLISIERKKNRKVASDDFKQSMITQSVKKAIAEIRGDVHLLIVSKSKQIALNKFYDYIIKKNTHLTDIIKDKLMNSGNDNHKKIAQKIFK